MKLALFATAAAIAALCLVAVLWCIGMGIIVSEYLDGRKRAIIYHRPLVMAIAVTYSTSRC